MSFESTHADIPRHVVFMNDMSGNHRYSVSMHICIAPGGLFVDACVHPSRTRVAGWLDGLVSCLCAVLTVLVAIRKTQELYPLADKTCREVLTCTETGSERAKEGDEQDSMRGNLRKQYYTVTSARMSIIDNLLLLSLLE